MSEVVVYSSNYCPYCTRAKHLLASKSVEFKELIVDGDPELRREMMVKSQQRTVPQIWIGEQHIGGCDDLYALERSDKLDELLSSVVS
ncbi:glutaredoxin 3 [Litoribacillus peritrichatus]|uniref:Glutaredoxin n=1 Tax=Litoribacillus peritrichatus TaxID=718191 RepID=A0ABP7MSB4_9GAMM